MPIIHVSQITVGDRQREEYGDLEDFANSLADARFGQLQPIRLDRDNRLVAGGRRVAAVAHLLGSGKSVASTEDRKFSPGEIWFEYKDTISKEHSEYIELEENIRRKQLTWQEEQKAIAKLHQYRVKENKDWTAEQTAELIGKKRRTVFNALELAKEIDKDPDLAKADTAAGAMLRLTRKKELGKREDAIRVAAMSAGFGNVPKVKAQIYHGDALEGLEGLESESVDAVIFNPPFGVEIESLFTSGRKIYENDDPHEMTALTERIVEQAYRILKPDRWMVMFYPTSRLEDVKGIGLPMWEKMKKTLDLIFQDHYVQTGQALNGLRDRINREYESIVGGMLRRNGFSFQTVPAQWIKPNKRVSALGDPYAQLNINYETFYFARKGKAILRKIPPSTSFIFNTPETSRRIHPLEMPVELWRVILDAICVGGESVVEPFAGSGAGGEASIAAGLNYSGWELDAEYALHAQTRLVGALATTMAPPTEKNTVPTSQGPLRFQTGPGGQLVIDTTQLDDSLFEDGSQSEAE